MPMPCAFPSRAREETRESRGMPCLFLNTERGFGGKPPKKSGFHRHLAGSKMPKETFFTAISRWRVAEPALLKRARDEFTERTGGGIGGTQWVARCCRKISRHLSICAGPN